ncbi:hypothetical protein [Polyangium sorediatum]|uniref:Tetratricopeptide repeat protein n=1 Tax=Polyangium sorediatum TaxID=889274 RepID=A0ABT6P4E4_9BACT|nr:hypothetical protein [Polyangium sorediatum]MDI1435477.1 hypothetical protein [Polyangium sorediatum]
MDADLLAPEIMNINLRIRAKDPTAFDDAVEFTEQYPEIWEVWHTLAYAHESRGDYAAAIAAATRAMDLDGQQPVLFLDRGAYALLSGDYERAVADFSQGLILCDELDWDDYSDALHFLRAEALVQLGKKAEALADLSHIRDDYVFWTIKARSKAELFALCGKSLEPRPEVITRESLRLPKGRGRLFFENWVVLPDSPDEKEAALATKLGAAGLAAIDAALLKHTRDRAQKSARIIFEAIEACGFPRTDNHLRLFARRLIALAEAGAVVARGNLHRPGYSEVRLPDKP